MPETCFVYVALVRVLVWRSAILPGSETFVRNQVDELNRLGCEAVLVGSQFVASHLVRGSDRWLFENAFREKISRRLFYITGRSMRLTKIVAQLAPDVIHAHFLPDALEVAGVAKRAGIPLIVTAHGYDVSELRLRRGIKAKVLRYRLNRLWQEASAIVAVSNFVARQLSEMGAPRDKIEVRYTGIPIEGVVERETVKTASVIFVGRLVEKKGVADLIKAISLQPKTVTPPDLKIIGSGPERDALLFAARSKGISCRFLGSLNAEEIHQELIRSTIFCGPSKFASNGDAEGLGHVFLEAAAAELPVVAYDHGGVSEAVVQGRTGFLVQEGDIPGLAEKLAELIRDQTLSRAMGVAGRQFIESRFDIRDCTLELLNLYQRVRNDHASK